MQKILKFFISEFFFSEYFTLMLYKITTLDQWSWAQGIAGHILFMRDSYGVSSTLDNLIDVFSLITFKNINFSRNSVYISST